MLLKSADHPYSGKYDVQHDDVGWDASQLSTTTEIQLSYLPYPVRWSNSSQGGALNSPGQAVGPQPVCCDESFTGNSP